MGLAAGLHPNPSVKKGGCEIMHMQRHCSLILTQDISYHCRSRIRVHHKHLAKTQTGASQENFPDDSQHPASNRNLYMFEANINSTVLTIRR